MELTQESVNLSFRKLDAMLRAVEDAAKEPNSPLQFAGRQAIGMIRKRTLKGIDMTGREFHFLAQHRKAESRKSIEEARSSNKIVKAKHEGYAIDKMEYIRTGERGAVPIPAGSVKPPRANLFLSGQMMNSLSMKAIVSGESGSRVPSITIFSKGFSGLATILHRGRKSAIPMPERPFMGLTKRQTQIVSRRFIRDMRVDAAKEVEKTR